MPRDWMPEMRKAAWIALPIRVECAPFRGVPYRFWVSSMADLILANGSYLLIAAVLVLTGAGLPVPEEVPVITAGIMASHGQLDPWMAFSACLVGALAGDCIMYLAGYCFGRSVLRENRYWAYFVKPEREAQMEELISRHGLKVLLLARFLVGLRSPVYLSAGILRLRFRKFFLIDLFCATTVIGIFFLLSFCYGQTLVGWIRRAEIAATLAVGLGLGVTALVYWRWHRRRSDEPLPPVDGQELPESANFDEEVWFEAERVA
jgi:membrane protein DedA with SNARE-associated domain